MTIETRTEFRQTLKLATPIIISNIGVNGMGLMDTMMVGQVSTEELAGVAAGNGAFWMLAVTGMGTLTAMDTLVSQAHGAGNTEGKLRALVQGLWLALFMTLILSPLLLIVSAQFHWLGSTPDILATTRPYLETVAWSIGPVLGYLVLARFWQAQEIVLPATLLTILANGINFLGNAAFVWGWWGFPEWGSKGVAIASLFSRSFLLICMVIYTAYSLRGVQLNWRLDRAVFRKLLH